MESKDKKTLSEADICDLFITPAIKNAGWDPMKQIRREVTLTPGPVVVRGNMSLRNKKKIIRRLRPVLGAWRSIAVVEAKDNNHTVSHGIQRFNRRECLPTPVAAAQLLSPSPRSPRKCRAGSRRSHFHARRQPLGSVGLSSVDGCC